MLEILLTNSASKLAINKTDRVLTKIINGTICLTPNSLNNITQCIISVTVKTVFFFNKQTDANRKRLPSSIDIMCTAGVSRLTSTARVRQQKKGNGR